jgi:hypothetical protein
VRQTLYIVLLEAAAGYMHVTEAAASFSEESLYANRCTITPFRWRSEGKIDLISSEKIPRHSTSIPAAISILPGR